MDEAPSGQTAGAAPAVLLYTRFAGVRPADVAEIWRGVREREPDARLLVVGQGAQGEERELAEMPGVELAGWMEREARSVAFGRAALAIAPWADTAANRARHSAKVLELMAAGVPVVAYRVGELSVTPGSAGALVPPGDADELAARSGRSCCETRCAVPNSQSAAGSCCAHEFNWDALAGVALAAYRGETSRFE